MITVTDRKYYSELINGAAFGTDTGNYTTNLVGSAMEKIRATASFTLAVISTSAGSSPAESFIVASGTITRNTLLWEDQDWRVGYSFRFVDGAVDFTGTITAIDVTGLIVTYTLNTGTDTAATYTAAVITLTTNLLAAEFHYGLVENAESSNYANKIDGSDMMYQLNTLTNVLQDMNPASGAQSWYTGAAQIRQATIMSAGSCTYEISQTFIIPYYKASWRDNIIDGTLPTDIWSGSKTLKHVWNIKLRTALSNPNSEIEYTDDTILGSVGFFAENYNGLGNNYTFTHTSYIDTATGDAVDGIQINRKTTVHFTIASSAKFSASTRIGLYTSAVLDPSQYAANLTPFETLWNWESLMVIADTTNTASGTIKRLDTVLNNTSLITCEADIEFSAAQQLLLTEGQEFIIAGQTANHLLTQANSDKVIHVIDLEEMVRDNDVSGLATFSDVEVLKHPHDEDDEGYTSVRGYVQNNYLHKGKITLNLDNEAYLKTLRFEHFARHADGREFVINRYYFDLSSEVLVPTGQPGVFKQAFNLDTTRGYPHPTGDYFNRVRFMEFIDPSPFRYGNHTTTVGSNHVLLARNEVESGYTNNDYTLILIDVLGGGFDIANMTLVSNEFEADAASAGQIRYFAIHNDADAADTTGFRWGTDTLLEPVAGVEQLTTVTFDSTLATTNYAVIVMDVPGNGMHTLTKAATGFTLYGIGGGEIRYIAALYTGIDGTEAGVQAITAGANSVTFANPLDSANYLVYWKDYDNYSNNIVITLQTANGFTFTAEVAGTLHFIAQLNE